jgi:ankyrin repeat protein
MNMHNTQKEMAEQVLSAIQISNAEKLSNLLSRGACPDGWWDEDMAERREDRMREIMRGHSGDAELIEIGGDDFMAEFEAVMKEQIDAAGSGPSPSDLPLHLAAERRVLKCLRVLLDAGADVSKRDSSGRTALFHASSAEVVKMLAGAGIELNAADSHGDDALDAALDGLSETCRRTHEVCLSLVGSGLPLIRKHPVRKNSRLYRAAFAENLDAVRFLLDAGHPIDADEGTTALHAICWNGDYRNECDEVTLAIVKLLLEAGIDPNARGAGGNTPLHEAMSGDGSNLVAAEELLAAGADINAINDDGMTPLLLHYETLFDYDRVVPFMLKHGANPLITDRRGQTVIDSARRLIAGENPMWRVEEFGDQGGPPCGWKEPARPGDAEYEMLQLLEEAAIRFQSSK